MLHLLHPAALWTLVALALPLAIHLRRPPPRTVRLGSLRFLENVPRRPLRNPRWHELLLLWTRLGLLAVLASWLAGPRWIVAPPSGPRRWALLDPTATLTGDARARWQGAHSSGYESRLLAPGFPIVSGEPSTAPDTPAPDLWSLLREADAELPAGSLLAVFSPGRLAALSGVRPSLAHCKVEWVQTHDPSQGIAYTWVFEQLPDRTLEGRSDARVTTFLPRPPDHQSAARAVSVLILHDSAHTADARFVEAAVRAAAGSLGLLVNVQTHAITPDAENAAATDWTFWLDTDPVPAGLASRSPRIVRYAGGEAIAADGFIVAPGDGSIDGVRLQKRTPAAAASSPTATALWSDGLGNPLLTYSHPSATSETWDLFTHFDPAWNDLPRTAALAAWVRAQLFPQTAPPLLPADPAHDRRLADPSQSQPSEAAAAPIPALASADQPTFDLHWLFWTLAALLFAAERTLSLRRPARPQPAATPRPTLAPAR